MCIKSREEIEALLERAPDRETRRKILEGLSACDGCEFGRGLEARSGKVTCERHLVELRNKVLHHTRQTHCKDELTKSAPNEPGKQ
jgi:hypothetical protein